MTQFRWNSSGTARERRGIPAVTETERIRNGQDKTAATPRPDRKTFPRTTPTASSSARREGAPEKIRDLAAIRTAHLGPAGVRLAMQLLNGWWQRGYRHEPTLLALLDWYIDRRPLIAKPFAYFNAGSPAFRDMHASIAARVAESDGEANKRAEVRFLGGADRDAIRERKLREARAPEPGECP